MESGGSFGSVAGGLTVCHAQHPGNGKLESGLKSKPVPKPCPVWPRPWGLSERG